MNNNIPKIVRIEKYEPADYKANIGAYLSGYAACEHCDGSGVIDGEAHLTSALHIDCTECDGGEVPVELECEKAEEAYKNWNAAQHPLKRGTRIQYGYNRGTIVETRWIHEKWFYTVKGDNKNMHHVASDLKSLVIL